MKNEKYTMQLIEASIKDIEIVGGKNASLGEMLQHLSHHGINIPGGFIVTAAAYYDFITYNQLDSAIKEIVSATDVDDMQQLMECGNSIRNLIRNGKFPADMESQIAQGYKSLILQYEQDAVDVAVRSSATAEDLPNASFAGQQDTYLNIRGQQSLLAAVKNCFASLFTDRAISYRKAFGYDDFKIGLAVCVQKMVRSDMGASGVAFSLDTETGFKDAIVINGSYGLGEMVVQGSVSPDEFIVFKPLLKQGYKSIIEKKLGKKHEKMVYGIADGERVRVIETPLTDSARFCLSDDQVLQLSEWVIIIENYYSSLKKKWCPMDIEWAVDGISGQLLLFRPGPKPYIHARTLTRLLNIRYTTANALTAYY